MPGVVGESSSESSPYSSAKDFCRRNLLLRAPAVGVEACGRGTVSASSYYAVPALDLMCLPENMQGRHAIVKV